MKLKKAINAPVEKVWKALTNRDQMKQWYFDIAEFKPEVGFEFKFDGGAEDKIYHHICKIVEVIPFKKLKHSWSYVGYEGMSFVTWELFDEGKTTRVKLTHEGLETFPKSDPNFAEESFSKGWTYIVGTSLKDFFEKEKTVA